MSVNLKPALDVVKLISMEQRDHVARMRTNPARFPPESVRIAASRLPEITLAYFVLECVLANPQWHAAIQSHLALKGVENDDAANV